MRRGAARSAAAKVRLGTSDRSSPSPFVGGSDNGDSDNESLSGKKTKCQYILTSTQWLTGGKVVC